MNKISTLRTFERVSFFTNVYRILLNIAPTKDAVILPPKLPLLFEKLARKTKGAVALVTGREIAFIDTIFPELGLAVSGLHGAELRASDDVINSKKPTEEFLNTKRYFTT